MPAMMRAVLDFVMFRPMIWVLGVTFGRATGLLFSDDWGDVAEWIGVGSILAVLLYQRTPPAKRRAQSYHDQ